MRMKSTLVESSHKGFLPAWIDSNIVKDHFK